MSNVITLARTALLRGCLGEFDQKTPGVVSASTLRRRCPDGLSLSKMVAGSKAPNHGGCGIAPIYSGKHHVAEMEAVVTDDGPPTVTFWLLARVS